MNPFPTDTEMETIISFLFDHAPALPTVISQRTGIKREKVLIALMKLDSAGVITGDKSGGWKLKPNITDIFNVY